MHGSCAFLSEGVQFPKVQVLLLEALLYSVGLVWGLGFRVYGLGGFWVLGFGFRFRPVLAYDQKPITGCLTTVPALFNPKPQDPKPQKPKTLNPKPQTPKTLNPILYSHKEPGLRPKVPKSASHITISITTVIIIIKR